MGLSKTEVNLRRLLATAPQQQNKAKLVHYVATLRELLEQLAEERSPEGLPRISKVQLDEFSEKIEAIAARFDVTESGTQVLEEPSFEDKIKESPSTSDGESIHSPGGLRRRFSVHSGGRSPRTAKDSNTSDFVKLDAAAQAHIDKHRKLQEDLTDEMVVLARQLKESSLVMNRKNIRNRSELRIFPEPNVRTVPKNIISGTNPNQNFGTVRYGYSVLTVSNGSEQFKTDKSEIKSLLQQSNGHICITERKWWKILGRCRLLLSGRMLMLTTDLCKLMLTTDHPPSTEKQICITSFLFLF